MNCRLPIADCRLNGVPLPFSRRACAARRAFTLTEVLITIGIIVILVSILVPVISGVRKSAKEADVKNQLVVLAGAIQNYYNDHRSYPGPFSNDEIAGLDAPIFDQTTIDPPDFGQVTMSENLALGLLGGLWNNAGTIEFDFERVGQGPSNVGASPKKFNAYIDPVDLTWTRPTKSKSATSGLFTDDRGAAIDTNIPEFVDRFSDPLPILYLRARSGAQGVMSDGGTFQYDLTQIAGYTEGQIGVGRKLPDHGLIDLGDIDAPISDTDVNDALPYFKNPTLTPVGTINDDATPHAKDKFILISAGTDRTYGTTDDITSFGSVGQ